MGRRREEGWRQQEALAGLDPRELLRLIEQYGSAMGEKAVLSLSNRPEEYAEARRITQETLAQIKVLLGVEE